MSNVTENMPDFVEVKVKSEVNGDDTFLPENEYPVGESMEYMVNEYSSIKVKKEFDYIDKNELNMDSLQQTNFSYVNFECKEEIKAGNEISNEFLTENQQNIEEFSEVSETDEKIDISQIILEPNEYSGSKFKWESENDIEKEKAFTRRKSQKQRKEKKRRNAICNKSAKMKNCQFCNKSFLRKPPLEDHILKQHKQEVNVDLKTLITSKIHKCSICNSYETTNKNNFDRHVNSVHNEMNTLNSPDDDSIKQEKHKAKTEVCQFCNKLYTKKAPLDDHMLKQHKQEIKGDLNNLITSKIYTCNMCNSYATTYKNEIERHVNLVHNDLRIKIKCQFCTESFIKQVSLDGHVLKMHKDKIKNDIKSFIKSKIHTCTICNSYETTNKSYLDHHVNSAHNEVKIKIKCQLCNDSFLYKHSINEHVLRKHKDKIRNDIKKFITCKVHVCEICNSYETTSKSFLTRHIKSVHSEVKTKMKCQFCSESFIFKHSLDEHILKKHKDDIKNDINSFTTRKVHICKICNSYQTMYKSNLDKHINSIHNEIKTKIKCEFCPKTFMSKISLDGHFLRKHKDKIENNITNKVHSCKMCSFESTFKRGLDKHVDAVHNKKMKWKCEYCCQIFKFKYTLNNHLLNQHEGEIESKNKIYLIKIHKCNICNSYQTRNKVYFKRHLDSNCHVSDK